MKNVLQKNLRTGRTREFIGTATKTNAIYKER